MLHARFFCALALLLAPLALRAQQPEADPGAEDAKIRQLAAALNYQKGHVSIKDGLATIEVPEEFRFLDAKDAQMVLTKVWGNPPDSSTLGMIVPANVNPADDASWGVIVTYEEDGYVKDNDASKINYDDLLKQMQEATQTANAERKKAGYRELELIGWAKPPYYDQGTHKLYWAKELQASGVPVRTLNYSIRMLGRRGVLVLNAVAAMGQLPEIEQAAPQILGMVNFQDGHRYTDFNPSTDKVATYGLAALVAGGVLAKAGFFKLLIAGALAAKKFIIIGAVAVYSFFKKIFGKTTPKPDQA